MLQPSLAIEERYDAPQVQFVGGGILPAENSRLDRHMFDDELSTGIREFPTALRHRIPSGVGLDEESGGGGVTPAVSSWMTHEWWSRTQRLPLIAHQGAYMGLSGMERNCMSGDGLARMRQPRAEYFARASSD